MNRLRTRRPGAAWLAGLVVAATSAPAATAGLAIDCADPALPGQQAVAALAGQRNLGQAYDTRARLLAEVRRACRRAGTDQVLLLGDATATAATAGRVSRPSLARAAAD